MRKPDKKETVNLFFSAFLILAFIVCAHFFTQFTANLDATLGTIINICIYAVFGLLVFYATRVGDGKAIARFSPITLIVLVLPSLYIIIATLGASMPLHDVFVDKSAGHLSIISSLAAVALGYGLPYTFFSGFELADAEAEEEADDKDGHVEGGVEADILDEEESLEAEEEETSMQEH